MQASPKTSSGNPPSAPENASPGAARPSPKRLILLLLVGIVLVGIAWGVRSNRALREYILRSKDLPELEALARSHPDDTLAQYYLAKQYYLHRRFADAKTAYETAVRLDPDWARARLGLALSYYELGQIGPAKAEFQQTLRLDDRQAWAEYMLGNIAWSEGDIREALSHVQRAAELDPRSDQAWFGVAVCQTQGHNYLQAIDALRKALARREASAQYHTALGELLVYRGDTEEARQHLERALQLNPDYGQACAAMGSFLLRKASGPEALDRAEELLLRATRRETLHPADVYFDLGQVYIQKGDFKKAVDALQESLRKDARDERAYYALANAYRRLGDAKSAAATEARFRRISALHVEMQNLEARLSHNAQDATTHLRLARVYRDLGLSQEAAQQYVAYLQLQPRDAKVIRELEAYAEQHAQAALSGKKDFVFEAPK